MSILRSVLGKLYNYYLSKMKVDISLKCLGWQCAPTAKLSELTKFYYKSFFKIWSGKLLFSVKYIFGAFSPLNG